MNRTSVSLIIIASIVVGGAVYGLYSANEDARDAYAAWWAADLVVAHLEVHGRLPQDSKAFRPSFETVVHRSGSRPFSFEEIMARCEILTDIEPASIMEYAKKHAKPMEVVRLRSGRKINWHDRDPNRMILEYLLGARNTA